MSILNHQSIGSSQWHLQNKQKASVDCSQISFYDPIGLTFLAGFVASQLEFSNTLEILIQQETLNYLERIGFLSYLDERFSNQITINPCRPNINRRNLSNQLVEFKRVEFSDRYHIRDLITELSEVTFSRSDGKIPSVFVNDVFGELLDNIRRHSGVNDFFVIAQSYHNNVKISIADTGVGIPYKIRSEFNQINNDSEAIIHATKGGVSTYPEGGWGLTTLKSYLEFSGEYLFIVSNNGCVKFINNRSYIYRNFSSDYTGTFVEICFRTDVKRTPEIEDSWLPF